MQQLKDAMRQKLEQAGIGYEEINVFGRAKCNVHIKCLSRDTADKWADLLAQVFRGARVYVGPTIWDAKQNLGTVLNPTKRKGFLVAVSA